MKLSSLLVLSGAASALIVLSPFPHHIQKGETYELEASMDRQYGVSIDLVRKITEGDGIWQNVGRVLSHQAGFPGRQTYKFRLSEAWPTSRHGELYALWLNGASRWGRGGWAESTDWFTISGSNSTESGEEGLLVEQPEKVELL